MVDKFLILAGVTTVCRPVAKVDRLLDALQNYSAVNCFENSITKVILCLRLRILEYFMVGRLQTKVNISNVLMFWSYSSLNILL